VKDAQREAAADRIKDEKGRTQKKYLLPSGAHLMVEDGAEVSPGDILAKIPRETAKTKDITGGRPVITEIDGSVKNGDVAKQHRKIYVTAPADLVRRILRTDSIAVGRSDPEGRPPLLP
jgi:DNA-directed RNA polymerase subunit beta'